MTKIGDSDGKKEVFRQAEKPNSEPTQRVTRSMTKAASKAEAQETAKKNDTFVSAAEGKTKEEVQNIAHELVEAHVKNLRSNMTAWSPAGPEKSFDPHELAILKKMHESI